MFRRDTVSVYRRQHKCLDSDEENENEIDAPETTASSINTFSTSRQTKDKAKQAFASPNVYRKKRVEAPANFVREQKSYFEQVDAFELEEESPPSKSRWVPEPQPKDAIGPCMHIYSKGLLQVVQEDANEELHNDSSKCSLLSETNSLSYILKTPQSIQSLQKSKSKGPEQNLSRGMIDEVVHERMPTALKQPAPCKAFVAPKVLCPIIVLSDDENENFGAPLGIENFSQAKHRRRQAQKLATAGARQTVLQAINRDDSPVPRSREYKTHSNVAPVNCASSKGLSSSKKDPSQKAADELAAELLASGAQNVHSHHHTEEVLDEQIKKVEVQASKDENHLQSSKLNEHFASEEQLRDLNIHSPTKAEQLPIFEALLKKCGQAAALPLEEAIIQFSDMRDVVKLGEGTYGEAFRTSNLVLKIVPMDGSFLVNGAPQKTLAEMHTEVLLTLTINRFHKENCSDFNVQRNVCNNFIKTKMVKVCQGSYSQTLIKAWEEWSTEHESENDHPKVFPENQLYMLFVLADGGKDLESFSIESFDVARSILIQVTAALAVAEEDCEFEHRDLHWGNILVAETKSKELYCKLDGTDMLIKTSGILVQIIDFTLSRIFTGKEVLFCDLSVDPSLFRGPKGDKQAEVYRRMLHLTKGQWDKRFLKTNCYWIHYLVDILLTRKKFPCLEHESRALRAFKKRVLSYDSARTCLRDHFFASAVNEKR